jgi:DNA adenine methylase
MSDVTKKDNTTTKAKPAIKWVDGKRQLMEQIKQNLPEKFNNYFEPFIGGAAVFFELNRGGMIFVNSAVAVINDAISAEVA